MAGVVITNQVPSMMKVHWLVAMTMLVGGCSSVNLWPFGESGKSAGPGPRGPENASEYRCDGGKTFHVRLLDGGNAAWVFFPDRQVRLEKVAGDSGKRYSNGIATLSIDGAEATLTDRPALQYSGCKLPGTVVQ